MFNSMTVRNFRGLKDISIRPLERVNLIGGRNDTGKTALLEALYLHCNPTDPAAVNALYELRGVTSPKLSEVGEWVFFNADPRGDAEIRTEADDAWSVSRLLLLHSAAAVGKAELAAMRKEVLSAFRPDYLEDRKPWIFMTFKDSHGSQAAAVGAEVRGGGGGGLAITRELPGKTTPCLILSARGSVIWSEMERNAVAENHLFSELELLGRQDEVRFPLRLLEPRLNDLSLLQFNDKTVLHAQLEGLQKRIPMNLMGDGVRRLLLIVLMIANAKGGAVLVDEIDNGLHYSVLRAIWRAIGEAARRMDVQVFATTHSWECIRTAHEAFVDGQRYDLRVHRLDRTNGTVSATTYDRQTLEASLTMGLEVR